MANKGSSKNSGRFSFSRTFWGSEQNIEPLLKAGNEYRGAAVYLGHCR